jgi:hypothetical protein
MAIVFDLLLQLTQRLLTPWEPAQLRRRHAAEAEDTLAAPA